MAGSTATAITDRIQVVPTGAALAAEIRGECCAGYSAIALRARCVTEAAACGAEERDTGRHTCHCSIPVPRGYIRAGTVS